MASAWLPVIFKGGSETRSFFKGIRRMNAFSQLRRELFAALRKATE